jgi:hypothetical protein
MLEWVSYGFLQMPQMFRFEGLRDCFLLSVIPSYDQGVFVLMVYCVGVGGYSRNKVVDNDTPALPGGGGGLFRRVSP